MLSKPKRNRLAAAVPIVLLAASLSCVTVRAFSPCSGRVGSNVFIYGSGFSSVDGGNAVSIGGASVPKADVDIVSEGKLRAKVPAGAATGRITVSNGSGSGTSEDNFRVIGDLADWTFMVFLDADNDLESAGENDFIEMAAIGSCGEVNVVVQYDGLGGVCPGTKRFLVAEGTELSDPAEEDLSERNMGDPDVLADFAAWAIARYPARRYALVIWNHGGGWKAIPPSPSSGVSPSPERADVARMVKSIAQDDTSHDVLYMHEVRDALERARGRTGKTIDLLGFDACYMGMIEVAYSARGLCSVMVGSEETEPDTGWDYKVLLSGLEHSPNLDASQLAGLIVKSYDDSFAIGMTQSAYDMGKVQAASDAIERFTLAAAGDWKALRDARLASRTFHDPGDPRFWGVDLKGFAENVREHATSPSIVQAAAEMESSLDALVIAEAHSRGMEGSHGTAIYFPPDAAAFYADPEHSSYSDGNTEHPVDFARDFHWDEWLLSYYANTANLPAP